MRAAGWVAGLVCLAFLTLGLGAGCGQPQEIPLAKVPPPPPDFNKGQAGTGPSSGASPDNVYDRMK